MIEFAAIITIASGAYAIYFGISNVKRLKSMDDKGAATAIATINTKLDFIVKEVAKISTVEERLQNTNERLAKVESAVKSAHKRLDAAKV